MWIQLVWICTIFKREQKKVENTLLSVFLLGQIQYLDPRTVA